MGTADFTFGLEHRTAGATLFLLLSGELDIWADEELAPRAARLIGSVRPEVVIDLHHVTFLDAGGLRLLLGIRQRVARRQGTVRLIRANGQPHRVLRLAGLAGEFDVIRGEPDDGVGQGPAVPAGGPAA
ncbi:STAS domain-containing protein [Streptomyces sp. TRM66268-LWL]|uniref:STAS domain-containing protein n=1 Tax=Streptomyces polyasparticus TaxID=2767826 RepID=A0ABR7SJA8_9ACTN|nr:STAS domain-containing protein [Streptomyces polyasparticus]MBC9715049.1 STAS domain-containing protein [Streptomyces polyasparticus]